MITNLKLNKVYYVPKQLEPGILYFSKEFGIAAHLCPCGCGNKVVAPIAPTDWSLTVKRGKPTLYPSIGNWQIPCRSHYWVTDGKIVWSYQWTEDQIQDGRKHEEFQRKSYYENLERNRKEKSVFIQILNLFFKKGKRK